MKKILLVLLLTVSAGCSDYKKDEAFLTAAKGFYSLDATPAIEVIVNAEGDVYVDGVKIYDLEEVKTDTTAIYEHEIVKDYYGFSINGTKLSKTKTSYTTEKSVLFNDLEDYATKKP